MKSILVILFLSLLVACEDDWRQAEIDAREFTLNIPGSTGKVSCAKKDTDGDGYCSCSVFMSDGSITPIDCGCEKQCFHCTEGCKLQPSFKVPKTK